MLRDGDLIELHFQGTLDSGEVFDTSRGRRPRMFVLGRGQLLPAFEAAIKCMSPGETLQFRLSPEEAYGPHDPTLVLDLPRAEAPADAKEGDQVQLTLGRPATILRLQGDTVTIDANHQLAGLSLNFEVEILSARPTAAPGG